MIAELSPWLTSHTATIRGPHHIINNLLNQMQPIKMEIDRNPEFDPEVSQSWDLMFEQAIGLFGRLSSAKELREDVILKSVLD